MPPTQQQPTKADTSGIDPDLPMTPDGKIYHLACTAADIADKLIFVGDPGRVAKVAEYFDAGSVTFNGSHREINIITGTYKGVRVSVLSTGMGTDNVEIVMNELHALKEFDPKTHKWRGEEEVAPGVKKPRVVPTIDIIRCGTCGCPQGDVKVGSLAITSHTIGMDNTCRYYKRDSVPDSVKALEEIANNRETALGEVGVYASKASEDITKALVKAAEAVKRPHIVGITASGSGFYGCQGRAIGHFRGRLTIPDLVDRLGALRLPLDGGATAERVSNIEMETSALCYLSSLLGYRAGTVCLVVATRCGDSRDFLPEGDAKIGMGETITVALNALVSA